MYKSGDRERDRDSLNQGISAGTPTSLYCELVKILVFFNFFYNLAT
jgi:hypothetical protein